MDETNASNRERRLDSCSSTSLESVDATSGRNRLIADTALSMTARDICQRVSERQETQRGGYLMCVHESVKGCLGRPSVPTRGIQRGRPYDQLADFIMYRLLLRYLAPRWLLPDLNVTWQAPPGR